MSRQTGNLTLDTLVDLPQQCRQCVFWEISPSCAVTSCRSDVELDKQAWVSGTLLQWGSCGQVAYMDGIPVGFVSYAAAAHVPRAIDFPTGPASNDAALLMTVHVSPAFASRGVGRLLVQATADDLARRGVSAIEAFGDARGEHGACIAPADFFRAVGFETIRAHRHYPRLRMDLRDHDIQDEAVATIDVAVERWLAAVTPSLI